jgi:5-methyltetrahydrofolate--homocysteine methyltransferase
VPVAADSSNLETILAGLDAARGRPLLNSASLERIGALDIAAERGIPVVVTAAGEKGMPEDDADRVRNASRMVDAAIERGIPKRDLYIDALVFPISVDTRFGLHCLDAIRTLRAKYGAEIHITGGMSNVSFGLPCRRLINDVFLHLAAAAGADGGILDPAADPRQALSPDTERRPYRLAEDMLLGRDRNCKNFLRAYRSGEL